MKTEPVCTCPTSRINPDGSTPSWPGCEVHGGCAIKPAIPGEALPTVLRQLEDCEVEGTRYPAHYMAQALRELGSMIQCSTGGTFENDPPDVISRVVREAFERLVEENARLRGTH